MPKRDKSGNIIGYSTADLQNLNTSRELNKKWQREGFMPGPRIKEAGGPWKAAIYSLGDVYMRVVFRILTQRGLSLKVASGLLCGNWKTTFAVHADRGDFDAVKWIAFPRLDKIPAGKQYSTVIPFNEFQQLQEHLDTDQVEYDDLLIINWRKIKKAVDNKLLE